MITYLINIVLMFLWGGIFLLNKPSRNKKAFCMIISMQWILLSGLRHISIGADTEAYKIYHFDVTALTSWEDVIDNFLEMLLIGGVWKDPGYKIFEKLVLSFTNDYQVYLFIIAIIFTVPLGVWIYKNSSEPLMSFLIYSCLFASFFAITGHRQTIATALVVLVGYKFIKERRIMPFLILIAIAFTIHKSVVAFLPFYFIANKKITKKYIIIMAVIIMGSFIFKSEVMVAVGSFMGYEQYVEQFEGAGSWTFTAAFFVLTLITIYRFKLLIKNNSQVTHYINALIMASLFLPLTFIDPNAMRAVQYYSLFIMLLVPEIFSVFSKNERIISYYISATLLIVLYMQTDPKYLFFWQE